MFLCATAAAVRRRLTKTPRLPAGWKAALLSAALALGAIAPPGWAAQVQHLTSQTATATGAGAAGKPTLASFSIPSGKNRGLFIWGTFERDHCSPADTSGGLCTSGNTAGTGLGDNWP